jgi:hypothetical protein
MDVLAVDIGIAFLALALLAILKPKRLVPPLTRGRGALLAALGFALLLSGLALPIQPPRLPGPPMALDGVTPRYQFGEHHEIRVAAPPERVYAAVRAVTAREIRFFRLLTWLRSPRLPGRGEESLLNPQADRPLIDVATGSGFVLLHDDPPHEVVFGAIVCCGRMWPPATADEFRERRGSLARAVMNFHAESAADGTTRLVTQTRIHASDSASERRFATYWRLIYPGSAFIRRMWLRAVKERAEAEAR